MPTDPLISPRRIRRCRPFTTADAMTLVAAIALGYAILPRDWPSNFRQSWESAHWLYYSVAYIARLSGPFWLTLTAAFVVIRLREPHSPARRLARQPGTAAALAVVVIAPVFLLVQAITWATTPARDYVFFDGLGWLQFYLPPAVIGAWATLRATGRWRPEPGWIDPLGMTLAGGWIAMFVTFIVLLPLLAIRFQ